MQQRMTRPNVDRDTFMRWVLGWGAVFNLVAASLFVFPTSQLGQLVGMPVSAPPMYSAMLAWFVVLFGGAYAWLACQTNIDRTIVALAALGKTGVFSIILACWLSDVVVGTAVLGATGDLVFATIFAWWLLRGPAKPA